MHENILKQRCVCVLTKEKFKRMPKHISLEKKKKKLSLHITQSIKKKNQLSKVKHSLS